MELAEKEELVQTLEPHLQGEGSMKGAPLREQLEYVLRRLENRNYDLERQLREKDDLIEHLEEEAEKKLFDMSNDGESENSDSWLIGPPTKTNQLKELEARTTELQRVNSELKRKVIVCEEMIGTLSEQKLEKEESIKILVEEIAQCEVNVMGLKENNAELRVALDTAVRQLQSAQLKTGEEKAQIVSQLKDELTSLRTELGASKQERSVLSAKLSEQSEAVGRLLREKEIVLQDMSDLQRAFNELKRTEESLQREKVRLLQELSTREDIGRDRIVEMEQKLSNEFSELSEQNKSLRKLLNERQQSFLKSSAEFDEERIRMKRNIDKLTRLLREVSHTLDYSNYGVASSDQSVTGKTNESKAFNLQPEHHTNELGTFFEDDIAGQSSNEAWGILDENDRLNQSVEAMLFYGSKDDHDSSYLQNSNTKVQDESRQETSVSRISNHTASNVTEDEGLNLLIDAVNEKLRSVYQLISSLKASLDAVLYLLFSVFTNFDLT